eukprot:354695-Chlamydomonas_euryale.AAC.6
MVPTHMVSHRKPVRSTRHPSTQPRPPKLCTMLKRTPCCAAAAARTPHTSRPAPTLSTPQPPPHTRAGRVARQPGALGAAVWAAARDDADLVGGGRKPGNEGSGLATFASGQARNETTQPESLMPSLQCVDVSWRSVHAKRGHVTCGAHTYVCMPEDFPCVHTEVINPAFTITTFQAKLYQGQLNNTHTVPHPPLPYPPPTGRAVPVGAQHVPRQPHREARPRRRGPHACAPRHGRLAEAGPHGCGRAAAGGCGRA